MSTKRTLDSSIRSATICTLVLILFTSAFMVVWPGSVFVAAGDSFDSVGESYSHDGDAASAKKIPPPNVQGVWCGSLNDIRVGDGTITMDFVQKGAKLHGTSTSNLTGS